MRFASVCFLFLLLAGCSKELDYTEVELNSAGKDVQEFIHKVRKDNGYYLFMDGEDTYYLFLNGSIADSGETAIHFPDLQIEAQQGVLKLSVRESRIAGDSTEIGPKSAVLYRIQKDRSYDTLLLEVNGEKTSFDGIGM